jgi:hypothetical protein
LKLPPRRRRDVVVISERSGSSQLVGHHWVFNVKKNLATDVAPHRPCRGVKCRAWEDPHASPYSLTPETSSVAQDSSPSSCARPGRCGGGEAAAQESAWVGATRRIAVSSWMTMAPVSRWSRQRFGSPPTRHPPGYALVPCWHRLAPAPRDAIPQIIRKPYPSILSLTHKENPGCDPLTPTARGQSVSPPPWTSLI